MKVALLLCALYLSIGAGMRIRLAAIARVLSAMREEADWLDRFADENAELVEELYPHDSFERSYLAGSEQAYRVAAGRIRSALDRLVQAEREP
jgi:hypothetical protein